MFLRDIEEDEEIRGAVNLYKAGDVPMKSDKEKSRGKRNNQYAMEVDETPAVETDDEHEEPDFPEVRLEELLEDFDEMTLGDHIE